MQFRVLHRDIEVGCWMKSLFDEYYVDKCRMFHEKLRDIWFMISSPIRLHRNATDEAAVSDNH